MSARFINLSMLGVLVKSLCVKKGLYVFGAACTMVHEMEERKMHTCACKILCMAFETHSSVGEVERCELCQLVQYSVEHRDHGNTTLYTCIYIYVYTYMYIHVSL